MKYIMTIGTHKCHGACNNISGEYKLYCFCKFNFFMYSSIVSLRNVFGTNMFVMKMMIFWPNCSDHVFIL